MSEYQQTTGRSTSDWDELRTRIAQLEGELEQHREHEELVTKTLISATSHATAIRESARREAELTLRKARAEAEKRMTGVERERDDARNELLRLRRITEQMRRGLSEFLTAKVEELRLEGEEGVPASEQSQELDAVLGSAVEDRKGGMPGPSLLRRNERRFGRGAGTARAAGRPMACPRGRSVRPA